MIARHPQIYARKSARGIVSIVRDVKPDTCAAFAQLATYVPVSPILTFGMTVSLSVLTGR